MINRIKNKVRILISLLVIGTVGVIANCYTTDVWGEEYKITKFGAATGYEIKVLHPFGTSNYNETFAFNGVQLEINNKKADIQLCTCHGGGENPSQGYSTWNKQTSYVEPTKGKYKLIYTGMSSKNYRMFDYGWVKENEDEIPLKVFIDIAEGRVQDIGCWVTIKADLKYTLSGIAIDVSGDEFGGNKNPNPVTVQSGSPASIVAKEIEGYHFMGWRNERHSGTPSGDSTYTINSLTTNKTVYAVYEKNSTYEGYSKITYNEEENSTGWTNQDKKTFLEIPCTNDQGVCLVTFEHGFRRTSGDKLGKYSIFDTNNSQIFSGEFSDESSKKKDENIEVGSIDKCEKNEFSTSYDGNYSFATTSACVSAPYSFETNVEVKMNDIVYAGETATAEVLAWVSQPEGASYTTIARDAKTELIMTVSDSGSDFDGKEYIFGEHNFAILKKDEYSSDFNVPDIKAGAKICIIATITPESSSSNGTKQSKLACATVAKKPSFQVWGGSVYAAGNIIAHIANKNNVTDGIEDYDIMPNNKSHIYGSWDELNVIVGGTKNKTLASGASLANKNGGVSGYLSPLTISNNGSAGSGIEKNSGKRVDLVERFRNEKNSYSSDRDLSSSPETHGATLVAAIDGHDITISGNLKNRDQDVTLLSDMPVLILYAQNINISCNVTQVDAILIAEDTIDTCYDGGDLDSEVRSQQLIINGTVIANYLKLGRTYGAGTGEKSGVPAEIINASTGFYLLNTIDISNSKTSDQLYTAYLRELSPRY